MNLISCQIGGMNDFGFPKRLLMMTADTTSSASETSSAPDEDSKTPDEHSSFESLKQQMYDAYELSTEDLQEKYGISDPESLFTAAITGIRTALAEESKKKLAEVATKDDSFENIVSTATRVFSENNPPGDQNFFQSIQSTIEKMGIQPKHVEKTQRLFEEKLRRQAEKTRIDAELNIRKERLKDLELKEEEGKQNYKRWNTGKAMKWLALGLTGSLLTGGIGSLAALPWSGFLWSAATGLGGSIIGAEAIFGGKRMLGMVGRGLQKGWLYRPAIDSLATKERESESANQQLQRVLKRIEVHNARLSHGKNALISQKSLLETKLSAANEAVKNATERKAALEIRGETSLDAVKNELKNAIAIRDDLKKKLEQLNRVINAFEINDEVGNNMSSAEIAKLIARQKLNPELRNILLEVMKKELERKKKEVGQKKKSEAEKKEEEKQKKAEKKRKAHTIEIPEDLNTLNAEDLETLKTAVEVLLENMPDGDNKTNMQTQLKRLNEEIEKKKQKTSS